ncbi:serine hydrolase [Paracoccus onubensis]|uniref:serine hydrolase domain-containing protein n=1 Tax=Paracoccus onubensis TaxID=1675788 RepID=UPI002730D93E|nr:serine hydrolase [Paracoccus onubensis]MDP0926606.1 serine hydrolase [Paracoccus onubensis]
MRKIWIILKWFIGILVTLMAGLSVWLYVAPPDLIRVGSGYAAKIVCSNMFIAGRDPEAVLAKDVQAPGHPLLRLMRVQVDASEGTVHAGLLGLFGNGLAVHRQGTGCAVVPDDDLAAAARSSAAAESDQPDRPVMITSEHPALAAALDDPKLTGPDMRAVVVLRDGRIIGERYGAEGNVDQPLLGWSMTKTVTAALIGTLVREDMLSVADDALLPQWRKDDRAKITIADLLGMESGLAFNENYGSVTDVTRMLYLEPDMASVPAGKPLIAAPGEMFSYSSGTSVLLSRIWQNAFENPRDALDWPGKVLFGPLGMSTAVLETDARGTFAGSSYLYASARDWARFGQFLLNDGVWEGKRTLPAGWVDWMRTPTVASDGEYGRHVWLHGPRTGQSRDKKPDADYDIPDDAYWLLGHDGQTMTIIPSRDLVILRMGLTPAKLGYKPQILVEAVVKAAASVDSAQQGESLQ